MIKKPNSDNVGRLDAINEKLCLTEEDGARIHTTKAALTSPALGISLTTKKDDLISFASAVDYSVPYGPSTTVGRNPLHIAALRRE